MPRLSTAQSVITGFGGGEISPRFTLRADAKGYENALQECSNFLITPQHTLLFRGGMEFIDNPKYPQYPPRYFVYRRGGQLSDIVIEFGANGETGAGYARFWDADGDGVYAAIESSPGVPFELAHTYRQSQLRAIQYAQKDQIIGLSHPQHEPVFIRQKTDEPFTVELVSFPQTTVTLREFKDFKSPLSLTSTLPGTWTVEFVQFTANDKYNLSFAGLVCGTYFGAQLIAPYNLQYFGTTAQNVSEIQRALTTYHPLLKKEEVTVVFVSGTTYRVEFTGRYADRDFSATIVTKQQANADINVVRTQAGTPTTEPAWSYPFYVLHGGSYWKCILPHISTAGAGGNEPGVGATHLTYWVNAGLAAPPWEAWQPTGAWAAGKVYSPWDRGFPSAITVFQQRTLLGGSKDAPTTVWGSRVGDYTYFLTGINPSDALAFDMDSDENALIRSMNSRRGVLVCTASGDHVINPDGDVLSPTSIFVRRDNARRAAGEQMIAMGNDVFSVAQGRRHIHAISYERQLEAQAYQDVLSSAEHFGASPITMLASITTPFEMLWALRDDGQLICSTYDRALNLNAWQRHVTANPVKEIASVHTVVDGVGYDTLWVVVERDPDVHRLERLTFPVDRNGTETFANGTFAYEPNLVLAWEDSIHLDSYVFKTELAPVTTLTGLTHLVNKNVHVVADQRYFGEFLVSGAGTVGLPVAVTEWAAGLLYTARAVTTERGIAPDGSVGFGSSRRWAELYIRLLESVFPTVNGTLPPDRIPASPQDYTQYMVTGDVKLHLLGYDDGRLTIEHNYPLPCEIVGFYGSIGFGS